MPDMEDDDDRPRRRLRDDDDDDRPVKKKSGSSGLIIILLVVGGVLFVFCGGGIAIMIGLLLPATQKVREAAGRAKDQNNLKQVSLGFHNFESSTGSLSNGPGMIDPRTGKVNPALSFRVGLLPYLEHDQTYQQFKVTEPWDSPANAPLAESLPKVYASTLDPPTTNTTRFRVFTGPGTLFETGTKISFSQIVDGTSNTIMMIVADSSVKYSKVDELNYSKTAPVPSFGKTAYPGGTNVAMADGSVIFVKNTVSEKTLRNLIERNDGNVVTFDW